MSEVTPPSTSVTPTIAMLRTLGSVATISGLLVVLTYKLTLPFIEHNQRQATEQAIAQIFPQVAKKLDFIVTSDGLQRPRKGLTGETIYAIYDKDEVLQGVALPGAGQGYAGLIQILYAYQPSCHCIIGVKVLKMAETPGIGDRVTTDPKFQENFTDLSAKLNIQADGLEHPITAVKNGTKTKSWQIDSISGATISSRGLANGINVSAQRLVPLVQHNLAKLQAALLVEMNQ
ncbi:FMN-binding protein [Achromatium sp. WMS3]|nr:FMN-binding protein [Achromatium sp. WMS3]